MRSREWLSVVLAACMTAACGDTTTNNTTPDAGSNPIDTGSNTPDTGSNPVDTGVDTGTGHDSGPGRDAGPPPDVRAGGACMSDADCDDSLGQICLRNLIGSGFCTNGNVCTNGSRSDEEAECGGRGSTCLTFLPFNIPDGSGLCTRACTVNAQSQAAGACREGTACTGFWYRDDMGDGDTPGCFPFCTNDSQCVGAMAGDASVMHCNTRTGYCSSTAVNPSLRADGEPCNPQAAQMTMVPQCRGICFSTSSTDRTQGLCGSFINVRQTSMCPDNAMQTPIVPTDSVTRQPSDSIGICLRRGCERNTDCTAPTVCTYPQDAMGNVYPNLPASCGYPTTQQPVGIAPCVDNSNCAMGTICIYPEGTDASTGMNTVLRDRATQCGRATTLQPTGIPAGDGGTHADAATDASAPSDAHTAGDAAAPADAHTADAHTAD